ncbi:MAG: YraN family protein [Gammaproteobacteria bacterium]|nr:YraN family protein [Gammaproteobacteria bacterium]
MGSEDTPAHLHVGQVAEQTALAFLKSKGLELLEQNYRYKTGEIDIIMRDRDTLVFVEVRYRKSNRYGSGAETVTFSKRKRIIKTANHFLVKKKYTDKRCRFDVISASGQTDVGMKLDWIKNAFD